MLSFKQFQEKPENVEQGVMVNGVPAAVVMNDRSRCEQPVKQGVMVNGVPAAVVLNNRDCRGLKEDAGPDNWLHKNHNAHLGSDEDVVEDIMADKHKHSPENMKHLHRYTEFSQPLNRALYQAHVKGQEAPTHVRDTYQTGVTHDVHALDKAVEHHALDHDLHVYSGTHFSPGAVSSQHPEGHMDLPSYTSTSLDKGTAMHFGHSATYTNRKLSAPIQGHEIHGHILHLHLKPGDKGAYMGIKSAYPTEKEFILPRKTRIKVHPQPQLHHNPSNGHTYAIWHAETVKQ